MAQEFDSLYYNQEEVGLRLVEYRRAGGQYIETNSVEMEPTDEFEKPLRVFLVHQIKLFINQMHH